MKKHYIYEIFSKKKSLVVKQDYLIFLKGLIFFQCLAIDVKAKLKYPVALSLG